VKLKNETRYNGRDIRGLLLACARERGITLGNRTITVVHAPLRRQAAAGVRNTLKLMRPERLHDNAIDALAGVSADEPTMPPGAFLDVCSIIAWFVYGSQTWFDELPDWAVGRSVRFKRQEPKQERPTGIEYHQKKLAAEQAKLAEWEAKLEHAERFAQRWRKKVNSRRATIRRLKREQGQMVEPGDL